MRVRTYRFLRETIHPDGRCETNEFVGIMGNALTWKVRIRTDFLSLGSADGHVIFYYVGSRRTFEILDWRDGKGGSRARAITKSVMNISLEQAEKIVLRHQHVKKIGLDETAKFGKDDIAEEILIVN